MKYTRRLTHWGAVTFTHTHICIRMQVFTFPNSLNGETQRAKHLEESAKENRGSSGGIVAGIIDYKEIFSGLCADERMHLE